MSRKLGKQIAKGSIDSRLKERNISRVIRKIQKSEKNLLREIKSLIDSQAGQEDIYLATKNLVDSRKTIQKLKKLQNYVKVIQSFYRKAQSALLNGETMDVMARSLNAMNKIMSMENLDETMIAMESELDELDLNLDLISKALEDYADPLIDEEQYINDIIKTLEKARPEEIETEITKIVATDNLLPEVPRELFEQTKKKSVEN
jgi:DNA repair ATPase RecN